MYYVWRGMNWGIGIGGKGKVLKVRPRSQKLTGRAKKAKTLCRALLARPTPDLLKHIPDLSEVHAYVREQTNAPWHGNMVMSVAPPQGPRQALLGTSGSDHASQKRLERQMARIGASHYTQYIQACLVYEGAQILHFLRRPLRLSMAEGVCHSVIL
jgi:hypothetical protein